MIKKLFGAVVIMLAACTANAESEVVDWYYYEEDGYAIISGDAMVGSPAISRYTKGTVTVPYEINGYLVADVTADALLGCQGISEILVNSDNIYLSSVDGVLYDSCMKKLIRCPQKKKTLVVPVGVREIAACACLGCEDLTSIVLPETIEHIGSDAFYGCTSLRQITIPASVSVMDSGCLGGCMNLRLVNFLGDAPDVRCVVPYFDQKTDRFGRPLYYLQIETLDRSPCITEIIVPEGYQNTRYNTDEEGNEYTEVSSASKFAVYEMSYFEYYDDNLNYDISECPDVYSALSNSQGYAIYDNSCYYNSKGYARTSPHVVSYAKRGSCGWNKTNPLIDPVVWCGRAISISSEEDNKDDEQVSTSKSSNEVITLVTTNIVIHYIMQSEQSTFVAPMSKDVGIVNIIAEIKGGNIAIPESWVTNFPSFSSKFGEDFTMALTKPSGKKDGAGNAMLVWQDYVAGTDPTDDSDVFTASVTMVEGVPVVSFSPELTEAEAAKRVYKTWGKVKLQDEDWVEISAGKTSDYNFFKVTVEMK